MLHLGIIPPALTQQLINTHSKNWLIIMGMATVRQVYCAMLWLISARKPQLLEFCSICCCTFWPTVFTLPSPYQLRRSRIPDCCHAILWLQFLTVVLKGRCGHKTTMPTARTPQTLICQHGSMHTTFVCVYSNKRKSRAIGYFPI